MARGPAAPPALWVKWALATAVGGALTGALEGSSMQFFATLVLSGLLVGLAQAFVLRRALQAGLWVVASTVGWIIGEILRIQLGGVIAALTETLTGIGLWEVFWLNALGAPVTAAVFGTAQGLVLWRTVDGLGWWIGASAAAGVLQGAVSATTCAVACAPLSAVGGSALATALTYGAGWAAYGAVTGSVLHWLFRYRLTVRPA